MHCAVIEYFNSENGLLVLRKQNYDNKDEFNEDLYIYNTLITNLIEVCKESYLLDTYQSYQLKICNEDKIFIENLLKRVKPSEEYDSIYDLAYSLMINCLHDRNEEFAFKILYDITSPRRGNTISKEMYLLLKHLLKGDEDGLDNEYFVREYRINTEKEIYVRNMMNTYPNEKDIILPSKCKKKRK